MTIDQLLSQVRAHSVHEERESLRKGGMTLLEVVVYTGLLSVLTLPLAMMVLSSSRSSAEGDVMNRVAERSRTAIHRLSEDLRPALGSTLGVQGGQLTFNLPGGFQGNQVIPGPAIQYDLRLAASEAQNGVDDDGNGLVDEGDLVRTDLATGEEVTICGGVDLAVSSFAQNGTQVNVTLSNSGYVYHRDALYTLTRSLIVNPRN